MGRYVAEYTIGQPDDFIRLVSEDYFQKEGFKLVPYKGEMLWKKGRGVLTAPQYIKLAYGQGIVHVEAFIRWTILPGVYVGEMALDNGFVGAIPKSMLMDKVNTLLRLLSQPMPVAAPAGGPMPAAAPGVGAPQAAPIPQAAVPQPMPAPGAPIPAAPPMPGAYPGAPAPYAAAPAYAGGPVPVAVHNPTGKATMALVFGLLSVLGAVAFPVGIVFSILGIVNSRTGMKSTAKGVAVAGLVLSILFLVVSLVECAAMILRFWLSLI